MLVVVENISIFFFFLSKIIMPQGLNSLFIFMLRWLLGFQITFGIGFLSVSTAADRRVVTVCLPSSPCL